MQMPIKSKFRKSLVVRIGVGFFLFIVALFYVLSNVFSTSDISINPLLVMASMLLLFIIYASLDLFEIFKLTITKNGIERILVK